MNPLKVPIVQISLPASSSPQVRYAFGQALGLLRAQNILIFAWGRSVHNLRDLQFSPATKQLSAHSVSFDEALREAVVSGISRREDRVAALVERPGAKLAHLTSDRFWPVVVACGAGAKDKGERIWGIGVGGLGWAMFRWGGGCKWVTTRKAEKSGWGSDVLGGAIWRGMKRRIRQNDREG